MQNDEIYEDDEFGSFDEEDFACLMDTGRPSHLLNEDDFDYALELKTKIDNKWIKHSKLKIVRSYIYEACGLNTVSLKNKDEVSGMTSSSIEEIDLESGYKNTVDRKIPDRSCNVNQKPKLRNDSIVSQRIYVEKISTLKRRREWVESIARRSSITFQKIHSLSDDDIFKRFQNLMIDGVWVRRHQSGRIPSNARIFSSDGCQTIEWEEIVQRNSSCFNGCNVLGQRLLQSNKCYEGLWCRNCVKSLSKNTSETAATTPVEAAAQDNESKNNKTNDGEDECECDDINQCTSGTVRRGGRISPKDIISIHPADRDDPDSPGQLGSKGFRLSSDVCCPSLSFSIVYTNEHSIDVHFLDIECCDTSGRDIGVADTNAQDTYFVLLGGLLLIMQKANNHRDKNDIVATQSCRENSLKPRPSHTNRTMLLPTSLTSSSSSSSLPRQPRQRIPSSIHGQSHSHSHSAGRKYKGSGHLHLSYLESNANTDNEQFEHWSSVGTQILAHLKAAGLEVKCITSWDQSRVLVKIRCPQWRQEEVAESLRLRLRVRSGELRRFKVSLRDTFVTEGADGSLFRSVERQRIIDYILRSKLIDGGAELDECTELGSRIQSRFPLHMTERLMALRHVWVTFWKMEPVGYVPEPWSPITTPLSVTIRRFGTAALRFVDGLLEQPLDGIAEYYGEGVAFYFAWLSFYTRWLLLPALLGFIVFVCQVHSRSLDHPLCLPYAVFVMFWASMMLAKWRQRASILAHRWGVLGFEFKDEGERPEYRGTAESIQAAKTQKRLLREKSAPNSADFEESNFCTRLSRYVVTVPLVLVCMVSVLTLLFVMISTQDRMSKAYLNGKPLIPVHAVASIGFVSNSTDSSDVSSSQSSLTVSDAALGDSRFWMICMLFPCMECLIIGVTVVLFKRIARYLTYYENHQTESQYRNAIILKVFSFRFVTVFTSLFFYILFYEDSEGAYLRVTATIFGLMTVGHWWDKFIDICLPAMRQRLLVTRMRSAISRLTNELLRIKFAPSSTAAALEDLDTRFALLDQAKSECWEESMLPEYDTVESYSSLVVQTCFVFLFAVIFPLAPLIAVLNNLVLIRLDALKLTYTRKRPIARKTSGLGVWENILQIMSVLGVLTSCLIMGYTSNILQKNFAAIGAGGIAVVLFFLEHIVLFFKYWLLSALPRIPPTLMRFIRNDNRESRRKDKRYKKYDAPGDKGTVRRPQNDGAAAIACSHIDIETSVKDEVEGHEMSTKYVSEPRRSVVKTLCSPPRKQRQRDHLVSAIDRKDNDCKDNDDVDDSSASSDCGSDSDSVSETTTVISSSKTTTTGYPRDINNNLIKLKELYRDGVALDCESEPRSKSDPFSRSPLREQAMVMTFNKQQSPPPPPIVIENKHTVRSRSSPRNSWMDPLATPETPKEEPMRGYSCHDDDSNNNNTLCEHVQVHTPVSGVKAKILAFSGGKSLLSGVVSTQMPSTMLWLGGQKGENKGLSLSLAPLSDVKRHHTVSASSSHSSDGRNGRGSYDRQRSEGSSVHSREQSSSSSLVLVEPLTTKGLSPPPHGRSMSPPVVPNRHVSPLPMRPQSPIPTRSQSPLRDPEKSRLSPVRSQSPVPVRSELRLQAPLTSRGPVGARPTTPKRSSSSIRFNSSNGDSDAMQTPLSSVGEILLDHHHHHTTTASTPLHQKKETLHSSLLEIMCADENEMLLLDDVYNDNNNEDIEEIYQDQENCPGGANAADFSSPPPSPYNLSPITSSPVSRGRGRSSSGGGGGGLEEERRPLSPVAPVFKMDRVHNDMAALQSPQAGRWWMTAPKAAALNETPQRRPSKIATSSSVKPRRPVIQPVARVVVAAKEKQTPVRRAVPKSVTSTPVKASGGVRKGVSKEPRQEVKSNVPVTPVAVIPVPRSLKPLQIPLVKSKTTVPASNPFEFASPEDTQRQQSAAPSQPVAKPGTMMTTTTCHSSARKTQDAGGNGAGISVADRKPRPLSPKRIILSKNTKEGPSNPFAFAFGV
eukprot:gene654-1266_t